MITKFTWYLENQMNIAHELGDIQQENMFYEAYINNAKQRIEND